MASSHLGARTHVVTLRRPTGPQTGDRISPTFITNPVVQPTILGPEISQITLSVRLSDNVGVHSLRASISINSQQIGTAVLNLRDGTPQNGLWAGTFDIPSDAPDGQYEVNFVATDASNNSIEGKPAIVTLHRNPQTSPSEERQITITYRGEACITSVSSEEGKCYIRVTFTGPVTFNCCKEPEAR